MTKREKTGPWFVTLAAVMWAIDAPFRTYLTTKLSAPTIVLMETLLISICILPIFLPRISELVKLTWREWLSVAFIGLGGQALGGLLFTKSYYYLDPTVIILLQKLQPIIAIFLAYWILGEKLSKNFWAWGVVALFGAYIVTFPKLDPGMLTWKNNIGILLALGAVFFWGGSTVFGRYTLKNVSFQTVTSLRFLTGLVFIFLLNIYYKTLPEINHTTPKEWFYVFMTAIIAGLIALFIYYYGLKTTKASVATLCELAFPVTSVVVNWIFLGDKLTWVQIAGGLVLIFAITRLTVVNENEIGKIADVEARTV